jgi:hypothetical protein
LLAQQLNWLYSLDPQWTEEQVLAPLEGTGEPSDAAWSGFFASMRTPNQPLYARMKDNLLAAVGEHSRHRRQNEALAGMLLAGWGTEVKDGNRLVRDEELRQALIEGDEAFRLQVLWHLDRWSSEDVSGWRRKSLDLLARIWPLQTHAKSDAVSTRLAEFALEGGEHFPALVEAVLPLLRPIQNHDLRFSGLLHSESGLAKKFPRELLSLIYAVLPENASIWPWGIDQVIGQLSENVSLRGDARMTELRRRWSAR